MQISADILLRTKQGSIKQSPDIGCLRKSEMKIRKKINKVCRSPIKEQETANFVSSLKPNDIGLHDLYDSCMLVMLQHHLPSQQIQSRHLKPTNYTTG